MLTFVTLDTTYRTVYESWFENADSQRWLGLPSEEWWIYTQTDSSVYSWLCLHNNVPIGHIQIDVEQDGSGSIAFLVAPKYRRRGYGYKLLTALLQQPEITRLTCLRAWAEPDNTISQQLLTSSGFIQSAETTHSEGMLCYVYEQAKTI